MTLMSYYLTKIPSIAKLFLPGVVWFYVSDDDDHAVNLTFDDGPNPETTPMILDILLRNKAKATFFLTGENVQKWKGLFHDIRELGHSIGNHGYRHEDGWRLSLNEFKANVLDGYRVTGSRLFRPPYGRMTIEQYLWVKKEFRPVMWSDMPGDFDTSISDNLVFNRLTSAKRNGEIIVLHDNDASIDRLSSVLSGALVDLRNRGYKFNIITE